jgi:hypothetical protein
VTGAGVRLFKVALVVAPLLIGAAALVVALTAP